MTKTRLAVAVGVLLAASAAGMLSNGAGAASPASVPHRIDVKFRAGTDLSTPLNALTPALRPSVDRMARIFTSSDEVLRRLKALDLKLWYRITLKPGVNDVKFLSDLKRQRNVQIAEFAPEPAPPPAPPAAG